MEAILKEKKDQGWNEVHEQILSAPYCDLHKEIVKITLCRKCASCGRSDLCYSCFIMGKRHFMGYPVFDINDCDEETFTVYV